MPRLEREKPGSLPPNKGIKKKKMVALYLPPVKSNGFELKYV